VGKYDGPEYHQRLDRLVAQVRGLNEITWSPTPVRKAAKVIADELDRLVLKLRANSDARWLIEQEYERVRNETDTGLDGWPEPVTDHVWFEAVIQRMELMAVCARGAIATLPNPHLKRALPFAALGVLLLRNRYERPPAVKSNQSADVLDLEFVCDSAGIPKDVVTLRLALTAALKVFDPQFVPPEYHDIVYGKVDLNDKTEL
jgi:hypothetical protein